MRFEMNVEKVSSSSYSPCSLQWSVLCAWQGVAYTRSWVSNWRRRSGPGRKRTSGGVVARQHKLCSQARPHRPRSSRGPIWVTRLIPQVYQAFQAILLPPLRTPQISPPPQPPSLFTFLLLIPPPVSFLPTLFLIMTSLAVSTSSASSLHSASQLSFHTASSPPSLKPSTATSSASSSQISFSQADEG